MPDVPGVSLSASMQKRFRTRLSDPALMEHGARLVTECTVERARGRSIDGARCRLPLAGQDDRATRQDHHLGGWPLATPLVLLNSKSVDWPNGLANRSDLVGRNLMRHGIDLLLVMLKLGEPITGQIKELALNDFYFDDGEKLGTLQSFGPLPPISYFLNQPGLAGAVLALLRPVLSRLGEYFRAQGLVLTSIMEDLPYGENRVVPGESLNSLGRQHMRMTYRFHDSEWRRLAIFRHELKAIFKGQTVITLRGADDNKAIAHVCGTCRFGNDGQTSVLDRDNRAHTARQSLRGRRFVFSFQRRAESQFDDCRPNALRVAHHLNAQF